MDKYVFKETSDFKKNMDAIFDLPDIESVIDWCIENKMTTTFAESYNDTLVVIKNIWRHPWED